MKEEHFITHTHAASYMGEKDVVVVSFSLTAAFWGELGDLDFRTAGYSTDGTGTGA